MPHASRDARLAYAKAHYRANRALVLAARQRFYADNAHRIRAERALKRDDETKARNSEKQKARYRAIRAEVILAFGGRCNCCGERQPMFLELDHIGNDGAAHRRRLGRGSHGVYKSVKAQGFPRDRFQLLCANCNQGRQRNGGVCPHHG